MLLRRLPFSAAHAAALLASILIARVSVLADNDAVGFALASPAKPVSAGSADNLLFTGSFQYQIPIEVPPGVAGMAPTLALRYTSGAPNGWVGVGWDMSFGSIQRSTKNGPPRFDDTDTFMFIVGGQAQELARLSDGTYRAKIEGAFQRFSRSGDSWIVQDKVGNRFFFGTSAGSRAGSAAGTLVWAMDRAEDKNGNAYDVSYRQDGGQLYLDTVLYTTNRAGLVGDRRIVFISEARPEPFTNWRGGFKQTTSLRLSRIETSVNKAGSWELVKTYAMVYAVPSGKTRAELASVQVSGVNGSSTITLPPTRFTYASAAPGWNQQAVDSAYQLPVDVLADWRDNGVRFVELNGDGRIDIIQSIGGLRKAYLNTLTGWQEAPSWEAGMPDILTNYAGVRDNGVRAVDLNGDGLTDLVQSVQVNGAAFRHVWINNGSGWTLRDATWNLPSPQETFIAIAQDGVFARDNGVQFADMNGDGLPDLVQAIYFSGVNAGVSHVYLNTGAGWTTDDRYKLPDYLSVSPQGSTTARPNGAILVDLNGDGLADFVQGIVLESGAQVFKTYLNKNPGWEDVSSTWVLPDWIFMLAGNGLVRDNGAQLVDVNGDGLPDFVQSIKERCSGVVKQRVLLNTGSGWQAASGWTFPGYFTEPYSDYVPSPKGQPCTEFSIRNNGYEFLDVNADGMNDLVRSMAGGNGADYVGLSNSNPDVLNQIDAPQGGSTVLRYAATGTSAIPHRIPFPMTVLSSMELRDGRGGSIPTSYRYEGGLFEPELREFLGFSKVEAKDADGNRTVTSFLQWIGSDGFNVPSAALKGRPYLTQRFDASGHLLTSDSSSWSWMEWQPGVYLPQLNQQDSTITASAPSNTIVTRTNYFYDSATGGRGYGNLIRVVRSGDVNVAGDERTEETDYAENAPAYLVGFPKASRVKDSAGNVLAETQYYYDGSTTLGAVSKGNVTQTSRKLDKPLAKWISNKAGYNAWGQPIFADDAKSNRSLIAYDAHGLPASASNAAGHVVQTSIELRNGNTLAETDASGQTTAYRYDALGRVIKEIGPLDSEAMPTVDFNYHDELLGNPSVQRVDANVRVRNGEADVLWSRDYVDGLGRTYRHEREDATATAVATVVEFDSRGAERRTSLPFNAASGPSLWTETIRDALGRTVQTNNADGTYSTVLYDGKFTTLKDEKGRSHLTEIDGWGRVLNRFEPWITVPTRYAYDGVGRLSQLTDPLGNKTMFAYDSLGRKLSMTDPNTGTWSYTYDDNGNLVEQTDARGVKLAMRYDVLDRLLDRKLSADPNHATTQAVGATLASFAYDESAGRLYSQGKLTSLSDPSGTSAFYHDRLGRVITEVRTVDSVRYQTDTTFDALGHVTSMKYPSDSAVLYTYNAAGQLDRVTDGTGATVYGAWSGYDSLGRPARVDKAGAKARQSLGYDSQKQTLASLKTESLAGASPITLQSLSFSFDPVGNLSGISDLVTPSRSQTFAYDAVDRLVAAQGSYGNQSYAYDELGNLQLKGSQTYAYGDALHPHAVTATSAGTALGIDTTTVLARDFEPSEADVAGAGVPFTSGYRERALLFSSPSHIFIANGTETQSPSQFTLMAWVRPTAYPSQGYATVIAKSTGAPLGQPSNGIRLLMGSSGKIVFEMGRASAPLSFTSAGAVPVNRWTFVCASFDGTKARIFVNGVQQSSRAQTWSATASAAPVTMGASINTSSVIVSSTGFNGAIDDPRYQGRAWSVAEIGALYAAYQAGWTFAQDANGNRATKASGSSTWTYSFDAEGRLAKVVESGAVRGTFVYDASGQRVKKTTAQGTTLYIGDHYESRPNGDRIDHVFAGGQLLCDVVRGSTTAQTYYYHPDHLGSISVVTDANGNKVQELAYAPFGETITNTGTSPSHLKYTGQEEDSETGLYYYNARYYDPSLGRFISPDAIIPNASDSQSLNRYAYVGNGPTVRTDPTGEFFWIPVIIGAVIGGVTAAQQTNDLRTILASAAIGAASGAAGSAAGNAASNGLAGVLIGDSVGSGAATGIGLGVGTVVGGAVGGATGGALSSIVWNGDPKSMTRQGAEFGAISGALTAGLTAGGIPDAFSAALGSYAGVRLVDERNSEGAALMAFAASLAGAALADHGVDADGIVPSQGSTQEEAMKGTKETFVVTAGNSANAFWRMIDLISGGHEHTWHPADVYHHPRTEGEPIRYFRRVTGPVEYPGEPYVEPGPYRLFANNCTTRFGAISPSAYIARNQYTSPAYYWRY